MTSSTTSLSEILGNGLTYQVPVFQRDYSWKEENWIDLWEDIKMLSETEKDYYMGAIVLQKKGKKNFLVIDGQQRLTTLSILALAILKNIKDINTLEAEANLNNDRISELRAGFLGQREVGSRNYSSKLTLNENNDDFYQSKLLQLSFKSINPKTLLDSDKLLLDAFNFFYEKINEKFKNPTGEVLADFLTKTIGDKMMFIKIEVEDESSAYTLFETLNYRGVDLTVTDLLKNYIFSLLPKTDLDGAKITWKKIASTIGLEKFPTFLRHYWISKNPLVRQEQLFKLVRTEIKTNDDVFELLDNLEIYSDIYTALQDPQNIEWKSGDSREKFKRIRELKLFGVKQQLPLLMMAKQNFDDDQFTKLLKFIAAFSFRYNVVGQRQPNVIEIKFNDISQKIYKGEIKRAQDVSDALSDLFIPDTDFKNDFSTLQLFSYGRDKKLLRYILFEIENFLSEGGQRDYENDAGTIEHILPENPDENWEKSFPIKIQEKYKYRISNYTLLENRINRDCERKIFDDKKVLYEQSEYLMPRRITAPEWLPSTLDARQNDMAKWATAIWKNPFNS